MDAKLLKKYRHLGVQLDLYGFFINFVTNSSRQTKDRLTAQTRPPFERRDAHFIVVRNSSVKKTDNEQTD